MYKKLEQNLNTAKTERQKYQQNNNNPEKINTMNLQSEHCSANHLQQQQQQLLPDFSNQSFQEKNRINCIVGNKHSRTSKNTTTTWLRSLSLFKTKCRQEHQQRQQKHQHINNSNKQSWILLTTIIVLLAIIENSMSLAKADDNFNNNVDDIAVDDFIITATTIPLTTLHHRHHLHLLDDNSNGSTDGGAIADTQTSTFAPIMANNESLWFNNSSPTTSNTSSSSARSQKKSKSKYNTAEDSIFLRFAKRFTADNNLWSGIIQDCYRRPTFSCFQKNVYYYLNDVLDAQDVNVTQRLKFYKNENSYQYDVEAAEEDVPTPSTLSSLAVDSMENVAAEEENDVKENEIPYARNSRSFTDNPTMAETPTPIEEVTNALYGKSIKFAMTHDIELKLPEMMFDGATFRISPQAIEGNGVIAKLELIPKQQSEARLAGKILMKKIQKFLKSKLLLSFLALVLIIKIIKIKLFWLLPLVIGVGAAKKLLLKFLLFLFPALSHLFKLCSYYQQTYHSTKYHHHHHHINHHHTVVPAWHSAENAHIPEIIYTHPPKGHVSAYLHGAPIHESYGPPSHEHFETGWANSGPGLGSDFISDINRVAHIDDKTNSFKPHSNNDANELHGWGLGTTPINNLAQNKKRPPLQQNQQQQHNSNQRFSTTLQKPPINQAQQPQNYQKPQATSHTFNPFIQSPQPQPGDKQSFFNSKYRNNIAAAQSAPSPVYTPARQPSLPPLQNQLKPQQIQAALSQAAQIAAQYDPTRNQEQQQAAGGQSLQPQQQLSPELSAQLKEAIRIQAEQRLVQQQQKILDKQPFVQDGQPLMPLNYDPFYSPILLKIDKIVEQLGVTDDLCKERLVCSMYKDPQRYSPHSNFVSAELSRDTNELQPITNTNQAVVRFFRLIQAARDGQDQRDCLALYPNCSINTE
ncbi:hypothetical protein FF38_12540 [Lucilia cuprina]|uniref:Uncharacterized protein n=1 Tax=Lucilia cuprina TaxID=7375 RepID=A0A0L0BMS1_LUCCU|nr:hypothetical protein FF38_12540 [Lucilia cuprina]